MLTEPTNLFPPSNFVPGEGPIGAEYMFVGEAPGYVENVQRRPFRGPSGKLLDKTLEAWTDLHRKDVYITNICKHRPPKNRTPKTSEMKAYLPSFIEELERVNPRIVITLGGTALKAFDKKAKVSSDHGTAKVRRLGEWEGIVVAWFHPAYAIRFTSIFQLWTEDAKVLAESIRRATAPPFNADYQMITGEEVGELLRQALPPIIGFDTETTSPTRGKNKTFMTGEAEMIGWSVSWKEGERYYIPEPTIHPVMQYFLETEECQVICHNAKFEYKLMKKMGVTMRNFEDTKLAAYLTGEGKTGLKVLAKQWLGGDPETFSDVTKGLSLIHI